VSVKIICRGQTVLQDILGGKKSLLRIIDEMAVPSPKLMRTIGEEMVLGYQGGRRLLLGDVSFGPKGGMTFSGRNGRYSRGIMRRVSPDGKPYPILANGKYHAQSTLDLKERNSSRFAADQYVLRDTDDMMQKFTYQISATKRNCSARAGFFGHPDLNAKSIRLENGGNFRSKDLSNKKKGGNTVMRTIHLTPRPHRAMQPETEMVIRGLLRRWAQRFAGKSL
jgi:hypothetical protein